MAMSRIKTGDLVIMLAGKDKGRTGAVLKKTGNDRVIVEGVNLVKKHQKPNPNDPEKGKGGILEKEASVHMSNIALANPQTGKADRIFIKSLEDGRKVRCFKSNGEIVEI